MLFPREMVFIRSVSGVQIYSSLFCEETLMIIDGFYSVIWLCRDILEFCMETLKVEYSNIYPYAAMLSFLRLSPNPA